MMFLLIILFKGSGSIQVVFLGTLQDKNRRIAFGRVQRITLQIALVKLTLMDFLWSISKVSIMADSILYWYTFVTSDVKLAHEVGTVVVIISIVATIL